jgi:hypothetical protein
VKITLRHFTSGFSFLQAALQTDRIGGPFQPCTTSFNTAS